MMMCINEAGRNHFPTAIQYSHVHIYNQIFPNPCNGFSLNEKIGITKHADVIIRIMLKNRSSFEEDRR